MLEDLRREGVKVWAEDEGLRYRGPKKALTPDVLNELRARKQEVVRILREDEKMRRTGIVQSERQVFDLAREYFGEDDKQGAA
jgi:TubC N-terminal docking domain